MPDQQDIDRQWDFLKKHRETLTHYLGQQAQLGSTYVLPGVAHGIREARAGIVKCKNALRGWGEEVEDLPDDENIADEHVFAGYIKDVFTAVKQSQQPGAIQKLKAVLREMVHLQKHVNELKTVHHLLHELQVALDSHSDRIRKPDDELERIKRVWRSNIRPKIEAIHDFAANDMITIQPKLLISESGMTGPEWAKYAVQFQKGFKVSLQEQNVDEMRTLWFDLLEDCLSSMYYVDKELLRAVNQLDRLSGQILKLVGDESASR
jgi:hypothetical protein